MNSFCASIFTLIILAHRSVERKSWGYLLVLSSVKVGLSFVGETYAPNFVHLHICAFRCFGLVKFALGLSSKIVLPTCENLIIQIGKRFILILKIYKVVLYYFLSDKILRVIKTLG